jgi:hypothetical protein
MISMQPNKHEGSQDESSNMRVTKKQTRIFGFHTTGGNSHNHGGLNMIGGAGVSSNAMPTTIDL